MADQQNPFGQSVAQGTTLATQNVSAPIGAFGGLVGEAMQQTGHALQSAGGYTVNLAQRIQQRRDASDIMGAMTKAQKAAQDAWYNPETGYARRTGLSADGLQKLVAADMDRIGKEVMAGIRSKDAQELFATKWGIESIQHQGKAAEWEMHQMDNGHIDQVNDNVAVLAANLQADPDAANIGNIIDDNTAQISALFDGSALGKQMAEKAAAVLLNANLTGLQNAKQFDVVEDFLKDKKYREILAKGGIDTNKLSEMVKKNKEEGQALELGKQIAGSSIDKQLELLKDYDPDVQRSALAFAGTIETARRQEHDRWQKDLGDEATERLAGYYSDLLANPSNVKQFSDVVPDSILSQLDPDLRLMAMSRFESINSRPGGSSSKKPTAPIPFTNMTMTAAQFANHVENLAASGKEEDEALAKAMTSQKVLSGLNLSGFFQGDDGAWTRAMKVSGMLNSGQPFRMNDMSPEGKASLVAKNTISKAIAPVTSTFADRYQSASMGPWTKARKDKKDFIANSASLALEEWVKVQVAASKTHELPSTEAIEKKGNELLWLYADEYANTNETSAHIRSEGLDKFADFAQMTNGSPGETVGKFADFIDTYKQWEKGNRSSALGSNEELMKLFLYMDSNGIDNIDKAISQMKDEGGSPYIGSLLGRDVTEIGYGFPKQILGGFFGKDITEFGWGIPKWLGAKSVDLVPDYDAALRGEFLKKNVESAMSNTYRDVSGALGEIPGDIARQREYNKGWWGRQFDNQGSIP